MAIYEMRVYRCLPGRLPALLQRFEKTTLDLWKRHGVEPTGFWTTEVGESNLELTYLLRWESMAERETKWTAFATDPEWIAKRAESEKDGPILANIVNSFLKPTAFSRLQ
ncbi:MAG: NIPSNAP family protein [Rhodoblastus sp.]